MILKLWEILSIETIIISQNLLFYAMLYYTYIVNKKVSIHEWFVAVSTNKAGWMPLAVYRDIDLNKVEKQNFNSY